MQYLLTEDEYKGLLKNAMSGAELPKPDELQALCTKIANTMPIKVEWMSDSPAQPWGCILNKQPDPNPGYCDECPVQSICPKPFKEWSK